MLATQENMTSANFDWVSEYARIEKMLTGGQHRQVSQHIKELADRYSTSRYLHILMGMVLCCMKSPLDALQAFERAISMTSDEPLPELTSPAFKAYLSIQLALSAERRPANQRARQFFQENLQALKDVDSDLAAEVEAANIPDSWSFVDVWGQLHIFDQKANYVMVLPGAFGQTVDPYLQRGSSVVTICLNQIWVGCERNCV